VAEDELGDQDEGEAASEELDGEEGSFDLGDEQPAEDEEDEEEAVPVAVSAAPARSGQGRRR
jgi:hypothetical protein